MSEQTDHEKLRLWVDGRKTSVFTILSHGSGEYGDNLLGMVARELKVRRRDLEDLLDCPLSKEAYVELLTRGGHIRL